MAVKKTEDKDKQLPAVQPKQELAPNYNYGGKSGAGYEGTDADDFTTPFLGLLQALSPEVAEGSLEGARPGMLINTVSKELHDGKVGVFFVPVATQHVFVEWRPREKGGGIVARHEKRSDFIKELLAKGEFGSFKTAEGNEVIETFYMFGYLLDSADAPEPGSPMVISFTSTKIRVYKAIMQTLRTHLLPDRSTAPLWANRLLVKTVSQKNNKGSFFNFEITPAKGKVGPSLISPTTEDGQPNPLLLYGEMLNEQIVTGQRKMAEETRGGGVESDGEGGGNPGGGKVPF